MRTTILIASVAALASTSLFAQTVSLEIASGNFADFAADPVPEGTLWGIVVDSTGDGFGLESWGRTTLAPESFLQDAAGSPTGNWLGGIYASQDPGPPPDFHPGWFAFAAGIPHADGVGEANTGDQWGIIWFPEIQEGAIPYGTSQGFGFFTEPNLTIPSAGSTVTYSDFIGNDIKTADYFSPIGGGIYIIPEPSTYAAIFGFGVLLFAFVRRTMRA